MSFFDGDPREHIVFREGRWWFKDRSPLNGCPAIAGDTEPEAVAHVLRWRGAGPQEILDEIGEKAFQDYCVSCNRKIAESTPYVVYEWMLEFQTLTDKRMLYPWRENPDWVPVEPKKKRYTSQDD